MKTRYGHTESWNYGVTELLSLSFLLLMLCLGVSEAWGQILC